MLWNKWAVKAVFFVTAFFIMTVSAHAAKIVISGEIYDIASVRQQGESEWDAAVEDLRTNRSSTKSWSVLKGKAELFETVGYSSETEKKVPASRKAELLALSDTINGIQSVRGQSYIDSLESAKKSSYWGAMGNAAGEAVVRVGVPIANMANTLKGVRDFKDVIKLGKDIVAIGAETVSVGADINAMAYGVALGNEYMTMAQEYAAQVEKGKERINNGEILNLAELGTLHLTAQNAKAYGVIGSQISTIASTMNRSSISDVVADHWGAIVSTCLGAASAVMSEAHGAANKAKAFGAGAFQKDVFLASLKSEGVPGDIASTIVNNSDLIENMITDTQKAMDLLGDWGTVKNIANLFKSGLRDEYEGLNPNAMTGEIPIFDDELLAIYEQLFDEQGGGVIDLPIDQTFPMPGPAPVDRSPHSASYGRSPDLGDITIESEVGDVTVINKTNKDLEVNIHSIEAKGSAKSGDITLQGRGNDITVIKKGRKSEAEVNIGSVVVGD